MYFPFMVDLSGKIIAVIGGGNVAYRKCRLFLDFGAVIRVISPELSADFDNIKGQITYIASSYNKGCLNGAFAAIAATNNRRTNETVSSDCTAIGIPVNVVDCPELCSFFVPATVRRGDLTIGISTGGKSPSMAGSIRRELEEKYGEEYSLRLSLLGSLKDVIKQTVSDRSERRDILISAAKMDLVDLTKLINNNNHRGEVK